MPRAVYSRSRRPPGGRARYSDEAGFLKWVGFAVLAVVCFGWPGFMFADGGRWGVASWVAEAVWLVLVPVMLWCLGVRSGGRGE